MNTHQTIALWAVLATGCSAPRSFVVETEGGVLPKNQSLVRTQAVTQLQVDAASIYEQMIEYYVTNEETPANPRNEAPTMPTVVRALDAVLSFKPGSTELLPAYGGNRVELERIGRELTALTATAGGELQTVRIKGYASPDGSTARNEELAAGRALRFSHYLSRKLSIAQHKIRVDVCVEDWEGLQRLVEKARKPYAKQVDSVLNRIPHPDARRKALKTLDKGRTWKDMEQTLFARLRRMELEAVCCVQQPMLHTASEETAPHAADLNALLTLYKNRPEKLSVMELQTVAQVFRPGTEQFREVYEQMAYRFPDCATAQLNAGAAALAKEDTEAARFFLERVQDDPRAWINMGVLALIEQQSEEATSWFRKAMPSKPVLARTNLMLLKTMKADWKPNNDRYE